MLNAAENHESSTLKPQKYEVLVFVLSFAMESLWWFDLSTSIFGSDPIDSVTSPKKGESHFNQVDFSWWIHHWRWFHPSHGVPPFQASPGWNSYRRCFPLRWQHRSHQSPVRYTAASDNDRRRWTPGRCSGITGIWGSEKCMANTQGFFVSQFLLVEVWVLNGFLVAGSQFFGGEVFVGHFRSKWWVRTLRF